MLELIIVLSFFMIFGGVIAFLFFYLKWFPKNAIEVRISEKKKGRKTLYRPEVKRPFFGWTGFWVSSSSGTVMADRGWTTYKRSVESYIEEYKEFKNL